MGFSQGEFVPLNVGGGAAALAHQKTKPEDFDYLMRQILFFLSHFPTINEIILIGHQDCGYYRTIANHPDKDDKEKKDLPRAVKALKHQLLYPAVGSEKPDQRLQYLMISAYYASFVDENHAEIVFEQIM
ncbi:MAG: hypothetical protein NT094_03560 [Candidatus Staskawiczbacteria bacterium]|nr:hypothetical protein [Candidatus Staskawiczbacteria bacterium]